MARTEVPAARGVSRPRLDRRLDRALDHRLVKITGPAGIGKTTALAHYATRVEVAVLWCVGPPDDAEVAALAMHAGPALLVVDDVHTAAGAVGASAPSSPALLASLLERLPTDITVVLCGRRPVDVGADLEALRAVGDLLELTADEFWFRSWEIERLFHDAYGQPLPPEEIDALRRLSGGWATVLHLFHRATAGASPDDRRRMLAGLPASPAVHDFLGRNVLADLDPDDLALLAGPAPGAGTLAAARLAELADVEGLAVAVSSGFRCPPVLAAAARSRLGTTAGGDDGDEGVEPPVLPEASGEPPWVGVLREALDGDPARTAEARWASGLGDDRVIAGLAWLLAGHLDRARTALADVENGSASEELRLLARLGLLAATSGAGEASAHRVVQVAGLVERSAPPWLAALARAAVSVVEPDEHCDESRQRAATRERAGDPWTATVILILAALGAAARADRADAARRWDEVRALAGDAVEHARQAGSPVLEAWARTIAAVAAARVGHPDAPKIARAAERGARAAGVPLAAALALAAVAALDPERRDALLAVATTAARSCYSHAQLLVGPIAFPPETERSAAAPDRPLVGRARELASLAARYRSVQGGAHQVCRLIGEAGVGKTRLAQELATHVGEAGGRVCWIRVPDGAPALWPWTQAAGKLVAGADLTELAAALGPDADAVLALALGRRPPGPLNALGVADVIARLLAWAAREQPLLLVLDDAQRAHAAAVRVLAAVDQSVAGVRAMIVVAYRDEEAGPEFDRLLGAHPVVRLGGLQGSDLAAIVALEFESTPPSRLVDAVGRVTGGNPAFIQDAVHAARLSDDPPETHDPPVPDGVRHLVAQRLARLSPDERTALQIASRFGSSIDVDLLAEVTGRDAAAIRAGLRRAAGLRLIAGPAERGWRFTGEAVRRVLIERIDDAAAVRFHAAAADHLERRAAVGNAAAAVGIAAHLLATRGAAPERLVRWVGAAADHLLAAGGAEQAAALVARALAVVGPDPAARGALLYRLGLARQAAGVERPARAAFLGAANAARAVRDRELLARAALGFGRGGLEPSTGRIDAVPLLEEALESVPDDDALRARLESSLAMALAGDPSAAGRRVDLTTSAYDLAFRSGDAEAVATALGAWHWTLFGPDLAAVRLDAATQMVRRAEQAGDHELALVGRRIRHHDLLEQGDVAAADIELAAFTRAAERLRSPAAAWRLGVMRVTRALLDGRFDEVERLATAAHRVVGQTSSPVPAVYLRGQLMVRARELGHLDAFARELRSMAELRPDAPVWRAAQAYLLAETGREIDARIELERFIIDDLAGIPKDAAWLTTVAMLADACARLGSARSAERLYRHLLPWSALCVVAPVGAAVLSSVSRLLGVLAVTMGAPDDAAAHFEDAIGRETRLGSGPLLARTKLAYGCLLAFGDDPSRRAEGVELLVEALDAARSYSMSKIAEHARRAIDDTARRTPAGPPGAAAPVVRRTSSTSSPALSLDLAAVEAGMAPVGMGAEEAVVPALELRCFGRYRLAVRGRPIELAAMKPRVRSLLWLLSIRAGERVHAEELTDALWPDADHPAGRRNLQVAISSLRQALEPGAKRGSWTLLARDGDSYGLVLGASADVDMLAFEQGLKAGRAAVRDGRPDEALAAFEQALSRYEGDLIPEAGPANWIVGPRETARLAAAEANESVAQLRLDAGDLAGAIAACERGLGVDRYRDGLWRVLIRACDLGGDHAGATRARRRYEAVLTDLGLENA